MGKYKRYPSECMGAIIEGEHDRIACESSEPLPKTIKTYVSDAAEKIN